MVSDTMVVKAIRRVLVNIGIAAATIMIILLVLFAYSSVWPPLVVVESSSMQHSDSRSSIGVIDTGDIVIVKKARGDNIITYIDGIERGHITYGEYGDVIVYRKGDNSPSTPVIHRAICKIIYNATGGGFDIPSLASLPDWQWKVLPTGDHTWWNLRTAVEIYGIGYLNVTLRLDLRSILQYFESRDMTPHGGYITMGDHNVFSEGGVLYGYYDQISIFREPVKDEWVIGKARGEIPWFGLLKLWVSGTAPQNIPENSKTNLFITIAVVIIVPIGIDILNVVLKRRGMEIFGWTKKFSLRHPSKRKGDNELPRIKDHDMDEKRAATKTNKNREGGKGPPKIDKKMAQQEKGKDRGKGGSRRE
ncbi:MAG: S26 family signal peptidase [Methanomassiliicoccales archaeon]|nr:S26 family signal peptidase [Methanomassiliicoccales archaeon]